MYPILQPAIALVIWSLFMLCWMTVLRLPALRKANISLNNAGGRGSDLDGVLPGPIQWKAHNYNHLMEQPTLFYAVVLVVAVVAPTDSLSLGLAWTYVALRVIHSLYQALVNVVAVRAPMFFVSSVVLIVLAVRAAVLVF